MTRELLLLSGILISPGFLLLVAFAIRYFLRKTGRGSTNLGPSFLAIISGGLCVGVIAFFHEPSLLPDIFGPDDFELGVLIPLKEEALKAFAILLISQSRSVEDWVDGIYLGALVGLGFTIVENHLFFMSAPTEEILIDLYFWRTLVPGHLFTAIVGAALGWQKSQPGWKPFVAIVGAFVLVVVIHGAGNLAYGPWKLWLQAPIEFLLIAVLIAAVIINERPDRKNDEPVAQ